MAKRWYREKGKIIWWLDDGMMGSAKFSFDRKKEYSIFGGEFPWDLTEEQLAILKEDNAVMYWLSQGELPEDVYSHDEDDDEDEYEEPEIEEIIE